MKLLQTQQSLLLPCNGFNILKSLFPPKIFKKLLIFFYNHLKKIIGFTTYVTSSDESENGESTEANDHIIDPMTTSCPDTLNSSQKQNTLNTKRPSKEILTPRLAAVLDKLKLSSRDTVHMLIAVLDAVGLNSSEYVINRTSIHQQRDAFRKANSTRIGLKLQSNTQPLTIHWDTKLLSGISGKNEDRLSIIATAPDFEQIINIPDIPAGTGVEIASAVYDSLEEYQVLDRIEAFVFDTTALNTGKFKGACNILEKKIRRDILFLGCRHHVFEIILAAVFNETKICSSTGPEVSLFKKFKKQWSNVKKDEYMTGLAIPRIKEIVGDDCAKILDFANIKVKEDFPRNDYKEFLELIIIFLGGSPPSGIKFFKPGALHLARWMAKGIYCLKILMFRNQFPEITELEINGLVEVTGFVIKCYAFFWFNSDKAEQAPLNDILFLRNLEDYKKINAQIADRAITKFINHLYYLNEECVAFSLFDDRIDFETKNKMSKKILTFMEEENLEEEEILKKFLIKKENLNTFFAKDNSSILIELVSKNTKSVFKRFQISMDFLQKDPSSWKDCEDYRKGKFIIQKLKVVNDCAERGIKLVEDYHEKITKDEQQRQYLFKVSYI